MLDADVVKELVPVGCGVMPLGILILALCKPNLKRFLEELDSRTRTPKDDLESATAW